LAARASDRRGQADVVGDDQQPGSAGGRLALRETDDRLVGGPATGISNLNAGGHLAGHEAVFGRAVEYHHDRHASRDDRPQPPYESRGRKWRRRPPEREEDIRAVHDQLLDPFEDASVVNHGTHPA
jgi:hypothetical protein